MDNVEENKQLSEAEHLIAMKNSQGWAIFTERYERIVRDISDLRTIPRDILDDSGVKIREATIEERTKEMVLREGALSLFGELFESMHADVDKFQDVMQHRVEIESDNIVRFNN